MEMNSTDTEINREMKEGVLVIVYTQEVTGFAEDPDDTTTTVTQYGCRLYKGDRKLGGYLGFSTEGECWQTIEDCLLEERRKSGVLNT